MSVCSGLMNVHIRGTKSLNEKSLFFEHKFVILGRFRMNESIFLLDMLQSGGWHLATLLFIREHRRK